LKYESAAAFREALEARLLTRSHESGVALGRLRKTVVFDRLLARLIVVAPHRWVLKGALALDFRLGLRSRTTKDMDLGRKDGEAAATADFIAAQTLDLGDHFVFAIEKTDQLEGLEDALAVRYHASCHLAGRRFDEVTVDVAVGESVLGKPDLLGGPSLLAFADIAPIEVPTFPLAQHIAEKLHAYGRSYGPEGRRSTRVKDLVDLVLIARTSEIDADELGNAIRHTFKARGRGQPPSLLLDPPAEWRPAFRRLAEEVGISTDMGEAHRIASALLNPILRRDEGLGRWDAARLDWNRPGADGGSGRSGW